jgi:hypothetical protein
VPSSQPYGDSTMALSVGGKRDGNIARARWVALGVSWDSRSELPSARSTGWPPPSASGSTSCPPCPSTVAGSPNSPR